VSQAASSQSDGSPRGDAGLFVTTSGGVLFCRPPASGVHVVIADRTRRWTGFFGLARHARTGAVIAARRYRLGTRQVRKHSTDVILHAIDPRTLTHEQIGEVRDVHDVHQIEVSGDLVFLTDTGLNRIHVWDLERGETVRIIEVGPERDDINHLNALLADGDDLLVGMNNRGRLDAAVMRLPLAVIGAAGDHVVAAAPIATVTPLTPFVHTHDLERYGSGLLACASRTGVVLRTDPPGVLFSPGGWVRGLAAAEEGLWVGISTPAERADRHSRTLDGEVRCYREPGWIESARIVLPGVGQVHDLLAV